MKNDPYGRRDIDRASTIVGPYDLRPMPSTHADPKPATPTTAIFFGLTTPINKYHNTCAIVWPTPEHCIALPPDYCAFYGPMFTPHLRVATSI